MKYPKPWDAFSKVIVSTSLTARDPQHRDKLQVALYVSRPGTPNNMRLVRAYLSVSTATKLRDALTHQIELLERRLADGSIDRQPTAAADPA